MVISFAAGTHTRLWEVMGAHPDEDSVIFTTVPVDIYRYTILSHPLAEQNPELLPRISAVLNHDGGTNYLAGLAATPEMSQT